MFTADENYANLEKHISNQAMYEKIEKLMRDNVT
jgi:hypothetical protein